MAMKDDNQINNYIFIYVIYTNEIVHIPIKSLMKFHAIPNEGDTIILDGTEYKVYRILWEHDDIRQMYFPKVYLKVWHQVKEYRLNANHITSTDI